MHPRSGRRRRPHAPKRGRPRPLALEALEDRLLLSMSIPLNSTSWTFLGAAPLVNVSTNYCENTTGRITAIAAHPTDANLLYVASASGGIWKTTDGGMSWAPLTDTQSTLVMGAIALAPGNPNVIYAGTGEANMGPSKYNPAANKYRDNIYYGRGVLKSVDGGSSWTLLGQAQFDRRTISKIVVDPVDANIVYLAVGAVATNGLSGNTGVWKSTDGGATWNVMVNGITGLSDTDAVSDLVMDPSDRQTLYAAVGTPGGSPVNSIYKTADGGATWARAGNFPLGQNDVRVGRITVAVAPNAPQTLYASVAASGHGGPTLGRLIDIYKTTDGGQNWTPLNLPFPDLNYLQFGGDYHSTLAVDPSNAGIVYAGGEYLIASTDGGSTWSTIADGENAGPHHDHHGVGFDAQGRFLDGNDGGIWRLESLAPVTWSNLNGSSSLNRNLGVVQFNAVALHPTNDDIAHGGAQDNGTEKFVDDGGDPARFWKRSERGDGGAIAVSSFNPDNRIYHIRTGFQTGDPNFFRRSLDGGQSWFNHVSGITPGEPKNFYPPFVVHPVPANGTDRLVLGTDHVYRSLDGANNWEKIGGAGFTGWTVSDVLDSLAVAPSETAAMRTIYASAGGHIFVTFNADASPGSVVWEERDGGLPLDRFPGLLVDPGDNQVAYAVRDRFNDGALVGHVFRTADGGQNWTDISGDLPDLPAHTIALDPRTSPNTLYVGLDDGVYASTDSGAHWSRFQMGLPNVVVADLKLNADRNILAAGTHGRGLWEILVQPGGGAPRAWDGTGAASAAFWGLGRDAAVANSLGSAPSGGLMDPVPAPVPAESAARPPLDALGVDRCFAANRREHGRPASLASIGHAEESEDSEWMGSSPAGTTLKGL